MSVRSISLLAVLLLLNGCGEEASDNREGATASSAPAISSKESTPEKEFSEMKRKADAGDVRSLAKLGEKYFLGEGTNKDVAKAVELWHKAAERGGALAYLYLGYVYSTGDGGNKNASKAAEWLQKAESARDPEVLYSLAGLYDQGKLVRKDLPKSLELIRKSADLNYAPAQKRVGEMYAEGKGVPKNLTMAAEWFEKSAMQGDNSEQITLGRRYAQGNGVPKNLAKAEEWFLKGSQGDAYEQQSIGRFYMYSLKPQSASKAQEWYRRAAAQFTKDAEKGEASAQANLGDMYLEGEGVHRDVAKAIEWYQKSAAQGNMFAQSSLGEMYAEGTGVPKDEARAVDLFQKSAAQGLNSAQLSLGKMYLHGKGVNRNLILAYAWFNLAASCDYCSMFSKYRDELEAYLTPAQRMAGQRLSSGWKIGEILKDTGDIELASGSADGRLSKQYTGTGFAVSSRGHALTNNHVIANCAEVRVAGRDGIVKVIASDSMNDLALLQLPSEALNSASINAAPNKLRQGEDIVVFGYPLNSVLSSGGNVTSGTISALTGLGNSTNQIQITAPIQPGSSGSPVMDKKGNVVGIVAMKLDDSKLAKATGQIGQNINFAVNGLTVMAFLDANNVPYKTSGGFFSREKSIADITEEARKWTVLVECWR